ncbi:hypothetical protein P9C73_gp46 [Bacillus Phage vB_BanS_McSteamy]|uniref:Uncharacterized protein n=1 Tax=Bacillus Phage vB_BanS_McSteamy TaxID=2894779 RepID=A0AAE8YS04_9CAUD|nr:hypothetical protein P9C73_gp46 [Bacillus Phage vB_BanS_McSteamy]UGO49462.1 hypothetical protein MCSTEAMY_46 [Bacillus Phage vB_BanS_McSteamy]
MKIPTIAFKAKNKEDRYLCDGPDCGDWSDEYLDTQEVTDALHIIKNDLTKPNEEDIKNFYKFIASLPLSNDVEFIKNNYDPVEMEITQEQLEIIRERNEW